MVSCFSRPGAFKEERVSTLDIWLMLMAPGGCLLGGWSIYWVRGQDHPVRMLWGRRLFIITLLGLGFMTLVAACAHARGLAPLGLIACFLVIGMLWEGKH
jgi:hypothetical protein